MGYSKSEKVGDAPEAVPVEDIRTTVSNRVDTIMRGAEATGIALGKVGGSVLHLTGETAYHFARNLIKGSPSKN